MSKVFFVDALSKESVKKIADWVEGHKGKIIRTGRTNIRIEGIDFYTTIVLNKWFEQGAQVYYDHGFMNISNWPKKELVSVFEVRMRGNVMAEGLEMNLRTVYADIKVISVKEK